MKKECCAWGGGCTCDASGCCVATLVGAVEGSKSEVANLAALDVNVGANTCACWKGGCFTGEDASAETRAADVALGAGFAGEELHVANRLPAGASAGAGAATTAGATMAVYLGVEAPDEGKEECATEEVVVCALLVAWLEKVNGGAMNIGRKLATGDGGTDS